MPYMPKPDWEEMTKGVKPENLPRPPQQKPPQPPQTTPTQKPTTASPKQDK